MEIEFKTSLADFQCEYVAKLIRYPDEWDVDKYPTLELAINEYLMRCLIFENPRR